MVYRKSVSTHTPYRFDVIQTKKKKIRSILLTCDLVRQVSNITWLLCHRVCIMFVFYFLLLLSLTTISLIDPFCIYRENNSNWFCLSSQSRVFGDYTITTNLQNQKALACIFNFCDLSRFAVCARAHVFCFIFWSISLDESTNITILVVSIICLLFTSPMLVYFYHLNFLDAFK
jgi:hypothetical protein